MNKSFNKLSLLGAALLVTSSAFATEWRTQWISNMGPIRYSFDRLHDDSWNLNLWSSAHAKSADSAFLHHGMDKKPLTALFFNKANFSLNEIFPNGQVPFNAQEYSPYLRLMRLSPRANYTEWGMNLGGRFDYAVCNGKGFVGVRANIPFRRIEIEREDFTDVNEDLTNDFVATSVVRINRNSPVNNVGQGAADAAAATNGASFDGSAAAINAVIAAVNSVAPKGPAGAYRVTGYQNPTDPAAIRTAAPINDPQSLDDSNNAVASVISAGGNFTAASLLALEADTLGAAAVNTGDFTASQVVAGGLTASESTSLVMATAINSIADEINAASDRGDRASVGPQVDVEVRAYRLDFVQALNDGSNQSAVQPGNGSFYLFGNDVAVAADQKNRATVGLTQSADASTLEHTGFNAWMPANATDANAAAVAVSDIQQINATLGNVADIGVFDSSTDYSGLIDSSGSGNFNACAGEQAGEQWLTFRRAANSADPERFARESNGVPGNGGNIARNIEALLARYQEHPLDFMERQGFVFNSDTVDGLGDIDIDLFYEHQINDFLIGGASFGIRAPSGQRHRAYHTHKNPDVPVWNPYTPVLGNDGHVEIKLAAFLDFDTCSWLNINIDASYNFVLNATEQRAATFAGMCIKNIGPVTCATVNWGYFRGHVDFNFVHPSDDRLRSMVGYEFYYKTRDSVCFKEKQLQSWLGGQYDSNGVLQPNLIDLDGRVAAQHTESIAHRARAETHYRLSQYVDLYAGAAITFAGQNIMADSDAQLGLDVRF